MEKPLEPESRIVFVCSGNTCRSAMAECYFRSLQPGLEIVSAGTMARTGAPASSKAQELLSSFGLDLSEHRARQLTDIDLKKSDTVFVMAKSHLPSLPRSIRVSLLSSVVGGEESVEDPYGGDLEVYRSAFDQMKVYLDALVDDADRQADLIPKSIQYGDRALNSEDLPERPLEAFKIWMSEALAAEVPEANAMCLCTAGADAVPDGRIVLLKGIDETGLRFFTNYEGEKARQLSENPKASAVFWWQSLRRQIRFSGKVKRTTVQESDDYFQSRNRESQLGAWASSQSAPLDSREALKKKVEQMDKKFPGTIPRPPHWGGFLLIPATVEFWQGRTSRLHDRIRYSRDSNGLWQKDRLMP